MTTSSTQHNPHDVAAYKAAQRTYYRTQEQFELAQDQKTAAEAAYHNACVGFHQADKAAEKAARTYARLQREHPDLAAAYADAHHEGEGELSGPKSTRSTETKLRAMIAQEEANRRARRATPTPAQDRHADRE